MHSLLLLHMLYHFTGCVGHVSLQISDECKCVIVEVRIIGVEFPSNLPSHVVSKLKQ